jgi:hypothetical protein
MYRSYDLSIRRTENGWLVEESPKSDTFGKVWSFESPSSLRNFIHEWSGGCPKTTGAPQACALCGEVFPDEPGLPVLLHKGCLESSARGT